MTAAGRLPVTGIVASRNEAALLPACLAGMSFCDEIVVIDVDSSDDTAAVAARLGARVVHHPYVPIAELARPQVLAEARHDWVLVRDPDEIIPPALAAQAVELFPHLDDDVALVTAPIQRYFRARPLAGGAWGGVRVDRLLARRSAVEFPTGVNRRMRIAPGFRRVEIPYRGDNAIAHLWVDGYRSFLEKHRRYLRLEGPDRADAGDVTGPRATLLTPLRSFADSFFREGGYRDGLLGLSLSVLWAWYRTRAEWALFRELRRRAAAAGA